MEKLRGAKDKLKKAHDMRKAADDVLADIVSPPKLKLKAKVAAKANGKESREKVMKVNLKDKAKGKPQKR